MTATVSELLRQLPLFAGLPQTDLLNLAGLTRLDHFDRDAVIFHQGDDTTRIWIVQSGQVKIIYNESDGREVILEMIAPGEAFGGGVLFLASQPATAKTLAPTQTVSLSREAYTQFLTDHPQVSLKLIRMLGGRLHSMMDLQILAGERVERRLAHILVKLADRTGRADPNGLLIPLPLSRQDLADMAGTTLETAIRTLSRFRAQGWVETKSGGYLLIRNLDQLRQQAQPA